MFISLLRKTALLFGIPLLLVLATALLLLKRFRIPWWAIVFVLFAILLVWAVFLLWKWITEREKAAAIERGLLKETAKSAQVAPGHRAQLAEVKRNLAEALATLRNGPEGRKALYTLPWYMLIGPPATGKTTAILNSGLNFPNMTTARRLRGAGGTRNCDWWLSTDAILLDTAGRFALSADRSETQSEWLGFLDLLRKNRPRGPINGLVLTYSMEHILQKDDTQVVEDARELRQRMDEVLDRLGWTFPVYVIFTKCDLLSGFAEFFSDLIPAQRQQEWGGALALRPPRDQEAAPRFLDLFDELAGRLRALRTRRMVGLEPGKAWRKVFMFPEEFTALRDKLGAFVETLFEPNPFKKDAPLFRGVYFTSGKQMGQPFEVVARKIQSILGLRAGEALELQEEKEDAYFVRNLFAKVLKRDKDLARRTRGMQDKFVRLQFAASVALAALSLLASIGLVLMYVNLYSKVKTVHDKAARVSELAGHEPDLVALQKLDDLHGELQSWHSTWLSFANGVRDRATQIEKRAERELVLGPIEADVGERLVASSSTADVRRLLRTQLLLVRPQARSRIGQRDFVTTLLSTRFFSAPGDSARARAILDRVAMDFLEREEPIADRRPIGLREGARKLNLARDSERYYRSVEEDAVRRAADLDLAALVPDQEMLTAGRTVPAAYTRAGWENGVREALQNVRSVLTEDANLIVLAGGDTTPVALTARPLLDRYASTYPSVWSNFFSSIELRSPGLCQDEKTTFQTLRSPTQSPLLRLLRTSAERSKLAGTGGAVVPGNDRAERVDAAMRPLHKLANADSLTPTGREYAAHLDEASAAVIQCERGSAALVKAENWIGDHFTTSDLEVEGALHHLLLVPFTAAEAVIQRSQAAHYDQLWSEKVAPLREELAGRYPFGNDGEAQPRVVVDLLGTNGKVQEFERALEGLGPNKPARYADYLRDASEIQRLFTWTDADLETHVDVELVEEPVKIGPGPNTVTEIALSIHGASALWLSPYPERSRTLRWTSNGGEAGCELLIEYGAAQPARIVAPDGPWSFFRLVDRASRQGDRLTWTFPDAGYKVTFRITLRDGGACPFVAGSSFRRFASVVP